MLGWYRIWTSPGGWLKLSTLPTVFLKVLICVWASEEACLIRDRDMRQGLFVLYKNFEQLFTMADDDISACVNYP